MLIHQFEGCSGIRFGVFRWQYTSYKIHELPDPQISPLWIERVERFFKKTEEECNALIDRYQGVPYPVSQYSLIII